MTNKDKVVDLQVDLLRYIQEEDADEVLTILSEIVYLSNLDGINQGFKVRGKASIKRNMDEIKDIIHSEKFIGSMTEEWDEVASERLQEIIEHEI